MKIAVFNCPQGITAEALVSAFIDAGLSRARLQKEIRKKVLKKEVARLAFRIYRKLAVIARRPKGPTKQSLMRDCFAPLRGTRNDWIVQAAIAIRYFQIEKCFLRNLAIGRKGNPKTLRLLEGFVLERVPMNQELVTPEGAAILSVLCEKETSSIPAMRLEAVGFGPNGLMISVGETVAPYRKDRILLLETNIDDMAPQGFELLYDRLFKAGALDVWVEPVLMKKMRPAFKLSVLLNHRDPDKISEVIFKETPSLGVRFLELDRFSLPRQSVLIKTRFGPVRMKIGLLDSKHATVSPEYNDVKRIAIKRNLSFRAVQKAVRKGFAR